ncbi:hypothetical protein [Alloyangia pacifica]|uniref:Uncharacterized protein n=1 Tax=Alloyangia pacifica TaxID=311180 RepID=A0A1I6WJL2_9RHOB|nr:hypothetical protein [Alloyangia pacifica]SDI83453.1 hypothetical protein SAMN04488245_12749 [Alloyangia pacifica]SFT26205.1 hypothetical protein SAMN04488050_12450 [Alloyangia pacifica]
MEKIVFFGGFVLVGVGIAILATDHLAFGAEIIGTFVSSRTILFPLGIAAVLIGGIAVLAGSILGMVRNEK